MEPKDRIIFAADVSSIFDLHKYLSAFEGGIGKVKVGKELLTNALLTDEPIIHTLMDNYPYQLMWDLKYKDIPPTMAGAAKAIAKHCCGKIFGFTVHCSAGRKALADTVQAVKDNFDPVNGTAPMVIGVTVLTSHDQSDLDELGIKGTPKETVLRWAEIADRAGVPAIVCSPEETKDVLVINPNFVVINPGIRFAGSDPGDQKRLSTPKNAIANGASYLVIGSDLRKGDPVANAQRATMEIKEGLLARD